MIHVVFLAVLNGLLLNGTGLPAVVRRLLRIFGVYVLLAFTLRSAALVIFDPKPAAGSFALGVLRSPTYLAGLTRVLPIVNLGLLSLLVAVHVLTRRWPGRAWEPVPSRVRLPALIGVLVVGHLLRIVAQVSPSGPLGQLGGRGGLIAPTVIAFVVLGTDWRKAGRLTRQFLVVAAALELVWAAVEASKTPILALLIIFYLDPNRARVSAKAVAVTAGAALLAFTVIQGLKPIPQTQYEAASSPVERITLNLSNRFDGLRAAGYAKERGQGSYPTVASALRVAGVNLVPQSLSGNAKVPAGIRWGSEIYGIPNNTTYYAETLSAEGFVVGGALGVVLWNLIGGGLIVALARGLRSTRVPVRLLACSVAVSSALFERGLLGQAELLGVALQGCLVMFAVLLLLSRAAVPTVTWRPTTKVGS